MTASTSAKVVDGLVERLFMYLASLILDRL